MKQYISHKQYTDLDGVTRSKVLSVFKVKPTLKKEIVNNEMKFDGITQDDLALINIGAMIEYLGDSWFKSISDLTTEKLCDNLWKEVMIRMTAPPKSVEKEPESKEKDENKN